MNVPRTTVKRKLQSHCFVPGCTTGYRGNKTKLSRFQPPKNPEYLEKWQKAIPRADKLLDNSCVVCELHFDSRFIQRHYVHTIQGKEVLTPRGKPLLLEDAVPTIFPNLPHYLSKKLPVKRSIRNRLDTVNKKPKLSNDNIDDGPFHANKTSLDDLCNVTLPSQHWVKICFTNQANVVCFCLWESLSDSGEILTPEKRVVVVEETELKCTAYLKNVSIFSKTVKSSVDLQDVLNEVNSVGSICEGIGSVTEFFDLKLDLDLVIDGNVIRYGNCEGKVLNNFKKCGICKKQRKVLKKRLSYKKYTALKPNNCKKIKSLKRTSQRFRKKTLKCKMKINAIKTLQKQKLTLNLHKHLSSLPHKQRLSVLEAFKASKRKSVKGMKYDKEWLLEAIIMRMKSPRLYEHIRLNKIMTLPGKTCINNALKSYQSGYGFNPKVFEALSIKTATMEQFMLHGCITFDEMKLSENVKLRSDGGIHGFVDYGESEEALEIETKGELCDHGLVMMFQPFTGDWTQILGVFATKTNAKAKVLQKLLIEAVILSENAGLFVDCITGDGASWNRSMWKLFGIGVHSKPKNRKNVDKKCQKKIKNTGKKNKVKRILAGGVIKFKVKHPVDDKRFLHFVSDFPHLLKCIRNSFLKRGYNTPDGEVRMEHIKAAWDQDQNPVCLRVMPKITKTHLFPNNFEKMRVNLAFQLFSSEVLKGLYIYNQQIVEQYGNVQPTISFIEKMQRLIEIMSSRTSKNALRQGSDNYLFIEEFLTYLNTWELHTKDKKGFLTESTTVGLKVSLSSVLSLIKYLTSELGYKYLLTSRLSQDRIENLFGIIRQSNGCSDHPTSAEFITIVECLCFYNLARPPTGSNVQVEIINSLLTAPSKKHKVDKFDNLIESGEFWENLKSHNFDHTQLIEQHSDARIIYYVAGYVTRKFNSIAKCNLCEINLQQDKSSITDPVADFTKYFDKHGLLYPSNNLFNLVFELENKFTNCFSFNKLHRDSIVDIVTTLNVSNSVKVGCIEHQNMLTNKIVKFYILTRLYFYLKQLNKNRESKRERQKYLKLRRNV